MDYLGWAGLLVTFLMSLAGLIKAFRTSPPEKADAMATLQEMLGVSLEQQIQLRKDVDRLNERDDKKTRELHQLQLCYDELLKVTEALVKQLEAHGIEPARRPKKKL